MRSEGLFHYSEEIVVELLISQWTGMKRKESGSILWTSSLLNPPLFSRWAQTMVTPVSWNNAAETHRSTLRSPRWLQTQSHCPWRLAFIGNTTPCAAYPVRQAKGRWFPSLASRGKKWKWFLSFYLSPLNEWEESVGINLEMKFF